MLIGVAIVICGMASGHYACRQVPLPSVDSVAACAQEAQLAAGQMLKPTEALVTIKCSLGEVPIPKDAG